MAEVVPFPLARRRSLILHQAKWFVEQRPYAAEANLQRQLQVQRETMIRRGIDPDVAERQCREMETAVRVAAGVLPGRSNG